MQPPEVFFVRICVHSPLPEGGQFCRVDELKLLTEVQAHLGLPLAHQPLGRHHQHALGHAAQLQFAQDQPGLDGLAQAHLVRQQVANAVLAHGSVERIELVRQRDDAGLDGRQQQVVLQGVQQLGRRCGVEDVLYRWPNAVELGQVLRARAHHRVLGGQPHAVGGFAPHVLPVYHTAGRSVA